MNHRDHGFPASAGNDAWLASVQAETRNPGLPSRARTRESAVEVERDIDAFAFASAESGRLWPRRSTWTVAEVAQRIGRDEDAARWYLDAYERLRMAGCVRGRWWVRENARRILSATAPTKPTVADPEWYDEEGRS
jgi:hypothetical protein